jgi:hypothetical protein
MNDAHQLAPAMLALVLAGVTLVAAQLYMEYREVQSPVVIEHTSKAPDA